VIFLTAIALHVKTAIRIRKANAKARTVDYQVHDKFMIPATLVTVSVVFLLFFILVHILQTVTFDATHVYQELVSLFQSFWMLIFYLAGLFVMTMHLSHSLANVLQTLGKTSASCHYLVWSACSILGLGFAIVPVYIYLGMS
jgi:succinate dehydrogenase / fumarate reductase cytochrome b subunit